MNSIAACYAQSRSFDCSQPRELLEVFDLYFEVYSVLQADIGRGVLAIEKPSYKIRIGLFDDVWDDGSEAQSICWVLLHRWSDTR